MPSLLKIAESNWINLLSKRGFIAWRGFAGHSSYWVSRFRSSQLPWRGLELHNDAFLDRPAVCEEPGSCSHVKEQGSDLLNSQASSRGRLHLRSRARLTQESEQEQVLVLPAVLWGLFSSSELCNYISGVVFFPLWKELLIILDDWFYSPHNLWASHCLCGPNTLVSRELLTAMDRKYCLSSGDW